MDIMINILIMYSTEAPTPQHVVRLESMAGVGRVNVALSESEAIKFSQDAEVILGHRYLWQCLPHTNDLRWVQATAAGVDRLVTPELVQKKPLLSRMPIFSKPIALHGLSMMLSLSQRLSEASFQLGKSITPVKLIPYDFPKRVVIFGMGSIGCQLGKLLQALGCHVTGVSRNPSGEDFPCDQWIDAEKWMETLENADVLFVTAPLTNQTRGLFGQAALSKLPSGAIFINLARGGLVDHLALVQCLEGGHLAGAGLDVIDGASEKDKQRLFNLPNVVYTPKISSLFSQRQMQLEAFVESQVYCYLNGEQVLHQVEF